MLLELLHQGPFDLTDPFPGDPQVVSDLLERDTPSIGYVENARGLGVVQVPAAPGLQTWPRLIEPPG